MKTIKIIAWSLFALNCLIGAVAGLITVITKGEWWFEMYRKVLEMIYGED